MCDRREKFLNIQTYRPVLVSFLGKPLPIQTVFVDGRTRPFTEKWAAQGKKPTTRVRINVWVADDDSVKIWEATVGAFKQVIAAKDSDEKKFSRGVFAIVKSGAGKETRYQVNYVRALTEEESRMRLNHILWNLAQKPEEDAPSSRPRHDDAPTESFAPPAAADPFERRITRKDLEELMCEMPAKAVSEALGDWKNAAEVPDNYIETVYNNLAAKAITE